MKTNDLIESSLKQCSYKKTDIYLRMNASGAIILLNFFHLIASSNWFKNELSQIKGNIIMLKKALLTSCLIVLLTGCGEKALTAQEVITQFKATGVEINDITPADREEKTPVPKTYKERLAFSIPEVTPKGGQIFTCEDKKDCDAIYGYFDSLRNFTGPYLYQSKNGLIVAQLNSKLSSETAEKIKSVINK